jgi:hypothetical protein
VKFKGRGLFSNFSDFNNLNKKFNIIDIDLRYSGVKQILLNLNDELINFIDITCVLTSAGSITTSFQLSTLPFKTYNMGVGAYLIEIVWLLIYLVFQQIIMRMMYDLYLDPSLEKYTACDPHI